MADFILLNKYNKVTFKRAERKGFISVIIPVYKDAYGLRDTLTSLKKQTLNADRYEIIVANDGADKKISSVCKKFRVREVIIPRNYGSYNARNKALEVSRGEFIAFTDADVIVPENWLESGLHLLQNADYAGGPVKFAEKEKLSTVELYNSIFEFDVKNLMEKDHFCVTANLFTKREVIMYTGGFDSRLKSGGDNEFGNRVHFSKRFIQKYNKKIPVIHPYRNFKNVLKKNKRIYLGVGDLLKFFPIRYKHYNTHYGNEMIYVLIPPYKYLNNIKLFFFIWLMKLINFYLKVTSYKFAGFFYTRNIKKRVLKINSYILHNI